MCLLFEAEAAVSTPARQIEGPSVAVLYLLWQCKLSFTQANEAPLNWIELLGEPCSGYGSTSSSALPDADRSVEMDPCDPLTSFDSHFNPLRCAVQSTSVESLLWGLLTLLLLLVKQTVGIRHGLFGAPYRVMLPMRA